MPTYSYHCDSCEHEFDELQKMQDDPLTVCPVCNKLKLRRLFGSPAVIFKGSGFHCNDYPNIDRTPK